jgi:hypothetical protein
MSVEQSYTARLWYPNGTSSFYRAFTDYGEFREEIALPVKDDLGQLLRLRWLLRLPVMQRNYPDYDLVESVGAESGLPRDVIWMSTPPDLGDV